MLKYIMQVCCKHVYIIFVTNEVGNDGSKEQWDDGVEVTVVTVIILEAKCG